MNIFHLDKDPIAAAQMMCDKHVVKMIVEYAQLMSTAHRVLDGELYLDKTKNGRNIKRWRVDGAAQERLLYKASHVNHPSNIWVRENNNNYRWLYKHFRALCKEYTHRYGKVHMTEEKLKGQLWFSPRNINQVGKMTEFAQAMPDDCKMRDAVEAYRKYYIKEKSYMAKWTNRAVPNWFSQQSIGGVS
jgi:hypothetical protein